MYRSYRLPSPSKAKASNQQQQQQPEPSIEATGSWSKGVAESKEEGWWPGESEDNAAESSAYEEAKNVVLTGVGDVGFTASPPTETNENEKEENENENEENEDKIRNEIKSKHEKRQVEPKPNVFFILIDDMGWNDIGYQSSDMQAVTPNLNRMANSGIKLPQYYSQALCTPARGALMTGRYPIRYGFQYGLIAPGAAWGLPLDEKLLPEYLSDHGYTCHMAGKWHLGGQTFDHMPHRRGFETSLSYTFGAETYWTHQVRRLDLVPLNESISEMAEHFVDIGFGNSTGYHHVAGRTPSPMRPHGGEGDRLGDGPVGINAAPAMRSASSMFSFSAGSPSLAPSVASPVSSAESQERYSTEMFTTRTLEILKDKTPFDEKPLFMYLAHQAVHSPLGPPPLDAFTDEEISVLDALGEEESSVRLSFAKVLMYLDKSIGQLMDYLEDEGWMDNSLVIVASDNGGCPSRGGSNTPFRGAKSTNWEGGTKVPAFAYSRSHIPEELWGTEYDGLVHVTDWLPTLAAAAGIELSGSRGDLDGVNHWEHIVGSSPSSPGNGEDGDGGVYGDFNVKLGDPDTTGGKSVSRSRSSNNAKTRIVGPRNEMLYNYDPYYLGAAADRTPSDPDYAQAQGAFRQGKWKFLFNECCLGHGTVQSDATMFEKNAREESCCIWRKEPADIGDADHRQQPVRLNSRAGVLAVIILNPCSFMSPASESVSALQYHLGLTVQKRAGRREHASVKGKSSYLDPSVPLSCDTRLDLIQSTPGSQCHVMFEVLQGGQLKQPCEVIARSMRTQSRPRKHQKSLLRTIVSSCRAKNCVFRRKTAMSCTELIMTRRTLPTMEARTVTGA
ncbi:unnamed protein product [Scytosiphon promiscuus]